VDGGAPANLTDQLHVARALHIEHDSQGFTAIAQGVTIAGGIAADARR
jgi:hypothetical protein